MVDNILDFQEIIEAAGDYKLLQTRSAKAYVQLMADICSVLNTLEVGRLHNIDAEELKNQTGHLVWYHLKHVENPIPCDMSFIPMLHTQIRKPTMFVLRRISKYLSPEHRRDLARLERERAFERIVDLGEFNVNMKLENALKEMNRYQAMAELVRGGGRKLDILMQAVHVPNRTRFHMISIDRLLRDKNHGRHDEALAWADQANLDTATLHGKINNGLAVLDSQAKKIWDQMEHLSGLELPKDTSSFDLSRTWYGLGDEMPRGEDFIKSFSEDEKVAIKIKRLTYAMVRVDWDADKLGVIRDGILVDVNLAKIQASQLANLTFRMEEKIASSTKPKGPVSVAIETDLKNGILSEREVEEAQVWIRKNKIRLQDLVLDTYETLMELSEKNKNVVLPDELAEVISRIKSGIDEERASTLDDIQERFDVSIEDLETRFEKLENNREESAESLLVDLDNLRRDLLARIDKISISNISFHKQLRHAFTDLVAYEQRLLELYALEERLEHMVDEVAEWLVAAYLKVSYVGIRERVLDRCLDVFREQMLVQIKKLNLEVIDSAKFATRFRNYLKILAPDDTLHMQQLLRECALVPKPNQLLEMLRGWEKTLSREAYKEKEAFILENNETLQILTDKVRADLRDRIEQGNGRGISKTVRFEVYGLSDWYAGTLRQLYESLRLQVGRLVDEHEGEQLVKDFQTLESQVIEAQKNINGNAKIKTKLENMRAKGLMSKELVGCWEADLATNFRELDQLLEEICEATKQVKLYQNRHGADVETDYLDITINISDIDQLKQTYDFLEDITLEDTKRFCVSYNLKTALTADLLERAHKKDATVPREIRQLFTRKAHKLFQEKRHIPLPLKTAVFKNSQDVFNAECRLICHTLTLVKPGSIRNKATYRSIVSVLSQIQNADHQMTKVLRLLWGRLQKCLFEYTPKNHESNYSGNRQALMSDMKDFFS